jgi:hypothetical protein
MRRFSETILIIDLYSYSYNQQFCRVKSQISGVFRDWCINLKILINKGLIRTVSCITGLLSTLHAGRLSAA